MAESDILNERVRSLQKLLQLELESADLMDCLLIEWAQNMRGMARHNVALENVLNEILLHCEQTGVNLGDLAFKAEMILACVEPGDASK